MRILHTSDWHVGRRIRGRDRSDEHRAVLAEIAGVADTQQVDLTLVAGDLFDSSAPTPVAEEIAWRALLALAEVSPVVVIAGNHDSPARLDAVAPLLAMGRVTVVGTPRSPGDGGVVFIDSLGTKVALLPFVSQRGIVRAADIMGLDPDQHSGKYQERMQLLVAALTEEMTPETVNLLVGHLTVFGAETGGGERHAHTVFDYAVPSAVFPGHLSYVALGHLHRQQKIPHAGSVWYAGSPLQLDFGEVEDRKGILVVEASPGLPAQVTTIPLSAGRRLITIKGTLDQILARADEAGDAHVRVELAEKASVGLADTVREAIPGTVEVVLEEAETTRKAHHARRTLTPGDAFHRYLEEKGVADPAVERLFAELLDEASA
ncbi:MAG: exonuclease SbcCD subunit D [Actinobacteria bacterium]|nr:exonuclease SbcCD subunit D [Actinomycetota bacterium]